MPKKLNEWHYYAEDPAVDGEFGEITLYRRASDRAEQAVGETVDHVSVAINIGVGSTWIERVGAWSTVGASDYDVAPWRSREEVEAWLTTMTRLP